MEPNENRRRMQQLAEKWLLGSITAEEIKEFSNWYNHFNDEEAVWIDADIAADEAALKQRIYNRIQQRIASEERGKQKVIFLKRHAFMVAASLVAVLIIAGIMYLYFLPKQTESDIAVNKVQDVQPGSNKALLTLSNGKTIVLDSAATGTLAIQASSKVQKLANGKIVYDTAGMASQEVLYNTLSTPRGGEYRLRLPDGTEVWLNAASYIKYPLSFKGNERKVEISGEVYFEVSKNKRQPFKVIANNALIEVTGTHFNINAYKDEANVATTLLEGSVMVKPVLSVSAGTTLYPGQQALLPAGKVQVEIKDDVDTSKIMAWRSGFFEFSNEHITTIMKQVSRWYDVDVVYEGQPITERFGGRISKKLTLSGMLKLLEASGIAWRLSGKTLYIKQQGN